MSKLPILYSFRRCPYAMRARLALYASGITCELREVVLRDKPDEMLEISPKATVPVLHLQDGKVIDESRDIMIWVLEQNDPKDWSKHVEQMKELVKINDFEFKQHLDKYKYSSRNPELSKEQHRENGGFLLNLLNEKLKQNKFLAGNDQTIIDLSVFPFIRQFAFVDKDYFDLLPYPHLQKWLEWHLECDLFKSIMIKYPKWIPGQETTLFAD
ncbi:MAG: glutathione S-transferase N-terminal domain-containing protein [Emcibacteraceae bacterium]|jgi:glutathione S-transferase|nr:glutathione S-transferase [Kordiimonadaceae bacterium]MDG1019959.1 glutathione S-transferase N-terminal domain-containing protein [Emcibacteraceae bacterium]MDG1728023.1 glutathione S-transferase N-terminal domain-containing protein [Emcibacteraceae bacterium]